MGNLVKSVGIIGLSEGNGHPFSYSAIINGYSDEGFAHSGWPGIHAYVRRRHASEFGFEGWKITHAWTQDPESTRKLCAASLIPNAVADYHDFLEHVDAVIIARDDYSNHCEMAKPFLGAGVPVFIDKPLSVELAELRYFKPYLEQGQLMSCSGMRYARELDEPRAGLAAYGRLKLMRGSIVLNWENYGIHMLDAVFGITAAHPVSVQMFSGEHDSALVRLDDGVTVQIDALGECARSFRIDIFGTKGAGTFDILDNFSMFRRMLWQFFESIRTGQPGIPAARTLEMMRVLIAGRIARTEKREVFLNEIKL